MRIRHLLPVLMLGLMLPLTAVAQDWLPDRRVVLSADTDLPGSDMATLLDTTLDGCERACLSRTGCTAFTFNGRNGSCFPKSTSGDAAPYQGAISGVVVPEDPTRQETARARASDLAFLSDYDLTRAKEQAAGLGHEHTVNGYTAEEHLQSAARAEAQGDRIAAANFTGAAVSASDRAESWIDYARRLRAAGEADSSSRDTLRDRAFRAAINGYLRAGSPALRHTALVELALSAETIDRGRDMVQALRLAQSIQPRDDTARLLDTAAGKYGFRITENAVEADRVRPRICVTFSEKLADSGIDYASYVQLGEPGLTVEAEDRRICVGGVAHGARHVLTFREGLPAADGQTLAKSVQIAAYVRDRSPSVRFPSRAYVLPRAGSPAIPVETVNARTLDLAVYRVSDRNLLRAIQQDYLGRPLDQWQADQFTSEVGEEIWTGTGEVAMEVNRDMTTRLPMEEPLRGLPAGIYALKAAIPGQDVYEHPAAWQWFVISDLGVTTLSGTDGLHVFVRSLGSAEPKAGVTVELLSRANAVLGTATTDDQGLAAFDAGLTRGTGAAEPALVVVKEGEADIAFLSLTDPEFDLSDRGVEGHEPAPPVDVFLATERGAYRAGETIHALALARDGEAAAIEGLPLTAILKRPDGVEYSRAMASGTGAGGHVFDLPLAGSAPRGVWRLEVLADLEAAPLAAKTVLVEDFLPERIDVTASLPEAPIALGDVPELTVEANFLYGAPGADLAIEGEVLLRAAEGLPKFPGYVFGRSTASFDPQVASFGGQRTDESGQARFALDLPQVEDPARPLEILVATRVSEGSGRPVERTITRRLRPAEPMIGIRPLFDGVAAQGIDARFALVGVGPEETPVPMSVRWTLNRIETDYQWYQQWGNWAWEPVETRTPVAEGEAELGTSPVEIGAPVDWGQYELVVERSDGRQAASSTSFYAGWYAPADVTATPDTLELSLDKPAYRPGETAQLRIVPRAPGKALVTVLSNRLIAMKAVDVGEGETLVELPVTDEWGTGVYVTATLLRPMDVAAGRNPTRALGLAHAAIDPGEKKLATRIETAPEAAPRGPMEVAVKVEGTAPGETAYATLAAVDVGILNLTGFETPDPEDHYFGQRKLGVGIRDLYGRLIDGMNGAQGSVRSGGDGGRAQTQAPPPTEELVAFFSGPVEVGPDGLARASFDLPAFNGTVRVMAVVWSKTGVGHAEQDVLVRDPVVVTASLPRFLAPGDESRLLLEIAHATGPAGRVSLDVSSPGLTVGTVPSGLDLAEKGRARIEVPVSANRTGLQEIEVSLTTPDGKQLTKRLVVPVEVNDPEIARRDRLTLEGGQTFTLDQNLFAGFVPGTGRATMAIGPIARLDTAGLLASLDRYPYGCTEQITSRALPLLYLSSVARALDLPGTEDMSVRIGQAIDEVLTNQTAEGAFGLWQAQSGDFWLDAYVTDFLSRAKAQGHKVPELALRRALDNLRNQVNYSADFDEGGEALAYALMVLAREGAAAIGDLRYYADVKADAFSTPAAQAQLGAALASYGDQQRADAMFRKAAARLNGSLVAQSQQVFRADYGTAYRDAATVLTLAAEAGSQAVDREAVTTSLAARTGTLSTQEAVWTLLATNALIDRPDLEGIAIDGTPATGPLVRLLRDGDPAVAVTNSGGPQVLTVTTTGVPSEPEPAGGNGYAIARSYYTMEGEAADPASVAAGTRLVAVLEVTPFGNGEGRLMVNDPLPAGFEIDNPNLMRGGQVDALDWLSPVENVAHAEFRQDRFLAALNRYDGEAFRLAYIVRAVSPGTFHHPAASVEDMYRPEFRAWTEAGRVTVTP
ncbi:alpha-2-macroglobulin family protein [Cereibacter sphaeroides]|uniref:Alpha-2-macroglobulin family protein n=1 Tax=Cereibacter sphaeroides TaxID=1063 RepID=A0AAX1UPS0_CERSP|nr:alpha-2-macroglobulin family protein [Cereibacter sphaeroides]RHZ97011.1 alpha-2-macroglobulin family protein [Cereibacter sphaeroides]